MTVQLNRVVKITAVIAIITGALLGMAGLGMGLAPTQAFLFAVGVAVALVPEGLLPTVTLSLARGASLMAEVLSYANSTRWRPSAIHSWSLRVGCGPTPELPVQLRLAYTADRMLSSVVIAQRSIVLGAPEAVLGRCLGAIPHDVVDDLAERGRRVLAVAEGAWHPGEPESIAETGLTLLALIGFEDPPRHQGRHDHR